MSLPLRFSPPPSQSEGIFRPVFIHSRGRFSRAPLARFEASLAGHEESAKAHFYADNFDRLFANA